MEFVSQFLDIFLHIDQFLTVLVANHGTLVYAIIALIIFCEVGLVVAPFLPGDSMLFVIGALCATGAMELPIVLTLFPVAAIAGDNFNRLMGIAFGHKAFRGKEGRFFNQKNLDRAQSFFEKYGARAITLCRFIPFFRTFVPFVAGMAGMRWRTFFLYSVMGGAGWVAVCVLAGYYFGNLEFIKGHFELVLLTIIALSTLPAVVEYLKKARSRKVLSVRAAEPDPPPASATLSPPAVPPQARICRKILYRPTFNREFFTKVGLAQKARDFCLGSGHGTARASFRVHILRTRRTIRQYGDLAFRPQRIAGSRPARLLCTACRQPPDQGLAV
jgi:membrane-associated protein